MDKHIRYLKHEQLRGLLELVSMKCSLDKNILVLNDQMQLETKNLLKLAADCYETAYKEITSKIDKEAMQQLYSLAKTHTIAIVPRADVIKKQKEIRDKTTIDVSADTIYTLAEQAMFQTCNNCTIKNFKSCAYRTIYFKLHLQVFDEEAKCKCPYKLN